MAATNSAFACGGMTQPILRQGLSPFLSARRTVSCERQSTYSSSTARWANNLSDRSAWPSRGAAAHRNESGLKLAIDLAVVDPLARRPDKRSFVAFLDEAFLHPVYLAGLACNTAAISCPEQRECPEEVSQFNRIRALITFRDWCEPLLTIVSSCSLSSAVRVTIYFSIPRFSRRLLAFTTSFPGPTHSPTIHASRDTGHHLYTIHQPLAESDGLHCMRVQFAAMTTVQVIPAASTISSGTESIFTRTGTRCANLTQLKVGFTSASSSRLSGLSRS